MKSIITLTLALFATFSTTAANQLGFSEIDTETALTINGDSLSGKAKYYADEENIPNPSTYISSGYVKSTEDVIKCDKEIVEGNTEEVRRLIIEKTFFDLMDENNRIVEGIIPDVAPLDFAYINTHNTLPTPVCQPKL